MCHSMVHSMAHSMVHQVVHQRNINSVQTLSNRKQGECYGARYAHKMSHPMVH